MTLGFGGSGIGFGSGAGVGGDSAATVGGAGGASLTSMIFGTGVSLSFAPGRLIMADICKATDSSRAQTKVWSRTPRGWEEVVKGKIAGLLRCLYLCFARNHLA